MHEAKGLHLHGVTVTAVGPLADEVHVDVEVVVEDQAKDFVLVVVEIEHHVIIPTIFTLPHMPPFLQSTTTLSSFTPKYLIIAQIQSNKSSFHCMHCIHQILFATLEQCGHWSYTITRVTLPYVFTFKEKLPMYKTY